MATHFTATEIAKGVRAEQIASNWLTQRGFTVRDVRMDKAYQVKDIDYVATRGKDVRTCEVKGQRNTKSRQHFYVEDILNVSTGRKGWIHYTQADYILVVSEDMLYVYRPEDMRRFLSDHSFHCERMSIQERKWKESVAELVLVPFDYYKKYYAIDEYVIDKVA